MAQTPNSIEVNNQAGNKASNGYSIVMVKPVIMATEPLAMAPATLS